MFDPRNPVTKNRDIYDETSYDKQDIKVSNLTTMVEDVLKKLRKAIVNRFLHLSDDEMSVGHRTDDRFQVRGRGDMCHSNLKEHTFLPLVVENHRLGDVDQLFHVRTSEHVKSLTL